MAVFDEKGLEKRNVQDVALSAEDLNKLLSDNRNILHELRVSNKHMELLNGVEIDKSEYQ